jgi:hypothetical protein
MTGPARNPRAGRQRYLVAFLQGGLAATAAVALLAAVMGSDDGDGAARVMVGLLIAVPLLRAAWLTIRWGRLRDVRFAVAGLALLAVVASGAALAA